MSTQPEGELQVGIDYGEGEEHTAATVIENGTIVATVNLPSRYFAAIIETHTTQRVEEAVRKIIETFRIESSFLVEETFELKHRLREPENSEYNLGADTMRAALDEGFDRLANDLLATLNNSKKETE